MLTVGEVQKSLALKHKQQSTIRKFLPLKRRAVDFTIGNHGSFSISIDMHCDAIEVGPFKKEMRETPAG